MKFYQKMLGAILLVSMAGLSANSEKIVPQSFKFSGPIPVSTPWLTDSVDINRKAFSLDNILNQPFVRPTKSETVADSVFIIGGEQPELYFLSFPLRNHRFASVNLNVSGSDNYRVLVDGRESSRNLKLSPGQRDITIEFLTMPDSKDTVRISLDSPQSDFLATSNTLPGRPFSMEDVLFAPHITRAGISPQGNYVIVAETMTYPDRSTKRSTTLLDAKTLKGLGKVENSFRWHPTLDILWRTEPNLDGSLNIITMNPATQEESILYKGIPDGYFSMSPDGNYLIYTTTTEGPTEDRDIYRIENPEDRQAGWRDRRGVAVLDLRSGTYRPITFGNQNVSVQDMKKDGSKLLLMSMKNRFEKRPTSLFSIYEYDLATNKVDTLVAEDGFINGAKYSPDGSKILITGSPEALGGCGNTLADDRIPSMVEGELFIMDLESGNITAPTRNFNPSVGSVEWPDNSSLIYFSAEDRDKVSLFVLDPANGAIRNMNSPEEIVNGFSMTVDGRNGVMIGESASNPEVLYTFSINKNGTPIYRKVKSVADMIADDIDLAQVEEWNFINSRGDTINGRFYLPPDFDPNKKYPMIVNYYGGCSPTSRKYATRYPHHLYATNGYVVYVINPSGATGFGQEFASRHVKTAGEGVAEDIIEGTKKFLEEHPYVDEEKIGCIGASYGGFMTQYLQTVTDLFAAAISHAGISDHTSYWGNGYWGYSYSEVSMGDSYPWSDPDLYVKQSPLYNADKINTPILFLHGDEDTNVPPGESIQLFTALKLLGKDTALVEVAGQNHHIMDIDKRKKWQDTIFAWFAKYLQDDPTWWEALYPPIPD